ncbi:hypothetical protein SLEP1_g23732 [Rubroshorea leprosula]|uniref:CCHC-type domain-containing protein n=1 Tax=Rubroshorea leprosula TaxID=152421 RepID=A0AAV5JQF1_9ROSI|nr:hypothetical protein SLEP1_g23732 [Rubroshorea leprosula]
MSETLLLSTAQPSSEESDLLDRSDQPNPQGTLMDEDLPTGNIPQPSGATAGTSYKDKLLVVENPSVISFSTIPGYMEEDSDVDDDPDDDAPPIGKWDFIDLGLDFFLVPFHDNEDLSKVIQGSPWFIGPYFVTMRRWEPNFDPEEALHTTTTTSVWAQLPNLSTDHYDPVTLRKIGNKVDPLLRVDAHTAHHTRGRYVRICVQIDLAQPVIKHVRIGKKKQRVIYEGVSALCFHCGRIGHRNNQCPNIKQVSAQTMEVPITQQEVVMEKLDTVGTTSKETNNSNPTRSINLQKKDEYAPWLLVERRRLRKKVGTSSGVLQNEAIHPKLFQNQILGRLNHHQMDLFPFLPPTPKNSSILGQGPNVSPDGDSSRLDLGLCLTQGISMVHEKSISSLACSNLYRFEGESAGDNPSHPTISRRLNSSRSLRDNEARVNRQRARRSRIIGPYHSSNCQQFSLHASFEGDDIPREDAKNSSSFKSVVVIDDSDGEGVRSASPSISLPLARFLTWTFPCPQPEMNPLLAQLVLGPQPSNIWTMKIISWNYRETKLYRENAKDQAASLGFPKYCIVDSYGLVGGLWLLWDDSIVAVEVVSQTPQAIHAVVQENNRILARLGGIQKSPASNVSPFLWNLEKELLQEYENILNLEVDLWLMKSRTNWLVQGDRNTKFFHCSIVQHRSNNRIYGLKDQRGNWVYDGHSLATIVVDYFNDLFASSHTHSFSDSFANVGCETSHSFDLSIISGVPSEKEILDATNSMQPYKAPGPDGIHPFFLSEDVWCECFIVLIPKVKAPESIYQFRPIGLCNTVLKIISKILVNRIKPWMDKIISPWQACFIPGRQGTDNVLILQEFVYFFRKKTGNYGDMICKLDLEKAYDRLEWSFIHETLVFFKFPPDIIRLILSSITSSSLSILINGEKTDSFSPSRGIQQGDPLSPYIFIMCMEHLSIKITSDMDNGKWKGCKADQDSVLTIKNLKSCSQRMWTRPLGIREAICSTLGYTPTDDLGKYLSIPISAQKLNKSKWQFAVDEVRGKLARSSPLSATVFGPHNANFANITVEEYFQAAGEAPNLINYDLPSNILAIIQATPISLSSTKDDGFAWKNSPDGEFSAALAYQCLKDPTMSADNNWKWVWKAPTLPKIQHFIWLLTHRRLKCFDFLNKLGICASASCPRCQVGDETVEHLVRMCPISSQILGSLLPGISTTQQQQLEFVEWLHFNFQCSEKSNILNIPWNVVFCFAIWVPYKRQNQRPTSMYKWIKPPPSFLKLNTDGSAIDNPGKDARGGLIRDSWGNWILGFSKRIGWSSILLAELWAIRDGLQLAVFRNFSHLLIETDSLTAVNLLSKDPIENHPLRGTSFVVSPM